MEAVKLLCILSSLMNPEFQLLLKDDRGLTLEEPTGWWIRWKTRNDLALLESYVRDLTSGSWRTDHSGATEENNFPDKVSLKLHCVGIWLPPRRASALQGGRVWHRRLQLTSNTTRATRAVVLTWKCFSETKKLWILSSEAVKYAIGLELISSTGDTWQSCLMRASCMCHQKDRVSEEEETIHLTTLTFLIAS